MRPHLLKTFVIACSVTVVFSMPLTAVAAKKVALLVGVNKYKKRGLIDKPLNYAERDVEKLSVELKKQGFSIRLMTSRMTGEDVPTRTNIIKAFDKLLENVDGDDIVFIGFAGHGTQLPLYDKDGKGLRDRRGNVLEDAYFCPVDAVRGEHKTLISLTKLVDDLDRKGGVNLIMVDACRDNPDPGRGTRTISGNELNGRLPANTAVIFSCSANQEALETKDAGGGHGVFFFHVLKGLQGEAANRKGEVSWGMLTLYLQSNVNAKAKEWFPVRGKAADEDRGLLQTPHAISNLIRQPILARVEIANPKILSKPSLLIAPFSKKQADAKRTEWATYLKAKSTITNSVGMKLNLIPPGEFNMGCNKNYNELTKLSNKYSYSDLVPTALVLNLDSYPLHKIRITKPYYLGTTEVTQKQWKTVMKSEPWKGKSIVKQGDNYPVTYVSWHETQKFIEKLNRIEVANYRLPTEAEWEYSCRSGSESLFCYGDDPKTLKSYAYYLDVPAFDVNNLPYAHPVGLKLPNNFGLYDVHGNVSEWCSDWSSENYYKNSPMTDPKGPSTETGRRVHRGGSYMDMRIDKVAMTRWSSSPNSSEMFLGFRIVMEMPN